MKLTIQAYLDGSWHDATQLTIPEPEKGRTGKAQLDYPDSGYVVKHLYQDGQAAASIAMPVEFQIYRSNNWFALLDDLMPAGASRRYWVNRLSLGNLPPAQQDYELLSKGTISPIGNLRIKESLEALPNLPEGFNAAAIRFSIKDVIERSADFLDYAQAMGAASGGATGAGGEAPKLLLRLGQDERVWIDTYQDDCYNLDTHYLVKFPRGQRSPIDCDILRTEYHFYCELAALGVVTVDTKALRLIEGDRYPSLWIPRFDVAKENEKLVRYGMESVYSIMGKAAGSYLNHFDCIQILSKKLQSQYAVQEQAIPFDGSRFVIDWVKRDFLNICFGNSDNHGRNTALLKTTNGITLSPVYDFAPMRADPEGITRTTTWGTDCELGGNFNWYEIATRLNHLVEADELITELRQLAIQVEGLPDRLKARGVPTAILESPAVGLGYLNDKLKNWNLR